MTRIVTFKPRFFDACFTHAPQGSDENKRMRPVLRRLANATALPGPEDVPDLRLLGHQLYARRIPGTDLVVIYEIEADRVLLHGLRLATW